MPFKTIFYESLLMVFLNNHSYICKLKFKSSKPVQLFLTKWIMFSQNHLISKTVPLGIEAVSCPCGAHHLH